MLILAELRFSDFHNFLCNKLLVIRLSTTISPFSAVARLHVLDPVPPVGDNVGHLGLLGHLQTATSFHYPGGDDLQELALEGLEQVVEGDHHALVLLGEKNGQWSWRGVGWESWRTYSVLGDKDMFFFFVEGLGSFGMTEVVMSFAVLWMIIMYRDYMGRKVVLCQVMEVCGQMGNSDWNGKAVLWVVIMYWEYLGRVMVICHARPWAGR